MTAPPPWRYSVLLVTVLYFLSSIPAAAQEEEAQKTVLSFARPLTQGDGYDRAISSEETWVIWALNNQDPQSTAIIPYHNKRGKLQINFNDESNAGEFLCENGEFYDHYVNIDSGYDLFWTIDNNSDEIRIAAQVETSGWVGIGFSPDGNMPGSDIVIGWKSGEQVFGGDRWAEQRSMPQLDVDEGGSENTYSLQVLEVTDECLNDPFKLVPGECGCGIPEAEDCNANDTVIEPPLQSNDTMECDWIRNNYNTWGELYAGYAASREDCIAMVQELCPTATIANYLVGGPDCWCQFGADMTYDPSSVWENCLLSTIGETTSCTDDFGNTMCDGFGSDGACFCGEDCYAFGDCCSDVCDVCGYCAPASCTDGFGNSLCYGPGSDGVCFCTGDCYAFGDCCEDVCDVCGYCGDCVDDPEAILAAEGNTCSTKFGLNGAPTPVCDIFDGDYNGFMRFVWQLCPSSCARCNDPDQYIVPDMCQDDEDCDDGEECRSPDWGTSCGNVQRLRKLNFGNTKGGCLFCLPML
uniref:SMB domain-containing protein n=1 Tax=Fibrocapsa japonica TaxID=94617 RepID=A0A7S2V5Q8_9STRA|mmetsp:Transcript_8437/g.12873  ORF Transcript_8437/g.12873 Transcript_8437/m.12873 type:complete len:523 (+) Transcript_8437:28-1596(+)